MPAWKTRYDGVETMTLAVMGCVVNGPGESKAANIGISLPGTGEAPNCPIYIDGQHVKTLRGTYDELAVAFQPLVDDYVVDPLREESLTAAADRLLLDALHRIWGFSTFRPLQRDAMHAVLDRPRQRRRAADRRRQVAVLPGAGGRDGRRRGGSATRRGFALVVSPLISLMKDQVDGLRVDGVAASYLNSTQTVG